MKKNITTSLSIVLLFFAWAAFFACEQKSKDSQNATVNNSPTNLIGQWDVQWVTYPDKNAPLDPNINLTMNGKMDLKKNGQITISAYGYDNCIFGKDTLIHSLTWEILGDTLNVKNQGDEFGMPYVILESSENKVKLQLVEDVFLFLTR
ncbi:hypothetical protein BFP72_16615 [Reichenbachiella sp. 5M10]|uniref:hypothetical protein n=1 Tax=Reichenbachiella sp. 5M10 TaxID=1889772 RepID=UPI000C145BBC|nr:hypothetical protein [Reichenbachiella sp. 5M10]PIB36909.1 hypothetical protein BFP72_16615 [Reichenbachiella sp. 5M10]